MAETRDVSVYFYSFVFERERVHNIFQIVVIRNRRRILIKLRAMIIRCCILRIVYVSIFFSILKKLCKVERRKKKERVRERERQTDKKRRQKLDIGRSLKLVSGELFRNCHYNV